MMGDSGRLCSGSRAFQASEHSIGSWQVLRLQSGVPYNSHRRLPIRKTTSLPQRGQVGCPLECSAAPVQIMLVHELRQKDLKSERGISANLFRCARRPKPRKRREYRSPEDYAEAYIAEQAGCQSAASVSGRAVTRCSICYVSNSELPRKALVF
jgi:hypothetical protein